MDFKPWTFDFSSDEASHLSLVDSRLKDLSYKKGLLLIDIEPTNVRGLKNWERGIEFDIEGEFNALNFRASFDADYPDKPCKYHICGAGTFHDSLFLNISGYYGDNLDAALTVFETYLDCVVSKSVPSNLLKPQNVWNDVHLGMPRGFEKEIPVFTSVGMKRLWRDFHMLEVRRMFWGDFSESTELSYEGRELNEQVFVTNCMITKVENSFSSRKMSKMRKERGIVIPDPYIDMQGYFDAIRGVGLPQPEVKTYHQIKSFEDKLRELPELWQNDLRAIYTGSGVL